jgi:protease I
MAEGKRVACVVGHDFEDSELRIPFDRLVGAGHEVVLIGAKKGASLEGKRGKEKIRTDLGIDEARVEDFDMLLIPGGYSPDNLRADERFVRFVKEFDDRGKLIAAVCHGPQLLMSARVVEGRTLTAWKTVRGDLELAGVTVKDEAVVRDANWITSRQPDDLEDFSRAILEDLGTARVGAREEAGVQAP